MPTHNELKSWGIPRLDVEGSRFGYSTIGDTEFTREDIDAPAMERFVVADLAECEQICSGIPDCAALTYWIVGIDFQTGTNCKLMNSTYNASLRLAPSESSEFQLRRREVVPAISILTYAGMLLPGTLYNTYCASAWVVDGEAPISSPWPDAPVQILAKRTILGEREGERGRYLELMARKTDGTMKRSDDMAEAVQKIPSPACT